MIISSLCQNSKFLHDKSPKLEVEGTYLKIIQAICDKLVTNREKLKAFSLKSGMRQECQLSPCLFNIVLPFLTRATKLKKEKKEYK
jgi:hypothetical protein